MALFCLVTAGSPGRTQNFDGPAQALAPEKMMEWLPFSQVANPVYDPETHKLGPWTKAIVNGAVEESRAVVALTAQEINQRKLNWLADDDSKNMGRMIEDIMVAVATGVPLTRDSFPAPVWAKINARRAKRGLAPV